MGNEKFMADYARALQETERLGKTFESKMKTLDKKFSAEYFVWMLENLLQYSFIELAKADKNVSLAEVVLSKRIIKYADIVSLGNIFLNEKYDWADFVNADPAFVEEWLEKVDKYLDPMQYTFVSQFATFDFNMEGDSFAEVSKGLNAVLNAFVNVDDNESEEEKSAVAGCRIMVTMREIGKLLNGR